MTDLIHITKLMMKKKKDVLLSILFGYIAGITAVGLFAANGFLISRAAIETSLSVLMTMIAIVKIGSFLRAGSRYAERYYSHRATFTMLSDLRVHFYEKVEGLSASVFQKYRGGDLLSRIVGDVESLQNFFLRVLYPPIIMILVFLSTILFLSFYSVAVVILLAIGLVITGFIIPAYFANKQKRISNEIREDRAHLSTEIAEWFQGFRELKIHQKLENKEQLLLDASDSYIRDQQQEGIQSIYNQSINTIVSLLISWMVLAVGAYLVATGSLDGVFLAMLVMVSLTVFEHSTPMAAFPVHYEDSKKATERLYSVVETNQKTEPQSKEILHYWQTAPSVHLDNVSFTFPDEQRSTLNNITLTLPAGSKTAIVGPSGSGKSTLLQLLLRIVEANEGEIYLNSERIMEMDQEELWKRINVILQENHFFYGTIKENLLLTNNQFSDEQLQQVLDDVDLPHFNLEDQVLEKGQNLSGGEKQRLAMARAVLKESSFWLLDEPTSSLDSWTEQRLYQLLFKQAKEDTVVIVSHRLAGLERMDQIVVMDQGRIVEVGTFNELIEAKGYFYQLKQIEKSVVLS
ncbi:thiol reductant ABC exporter subunit CydC [Bacillus suaedae]|uniref:Thiol reductant ABC exporter subunit CydC n=1 Tax=Halalkalibacter suaedae TaxID=2822140 RepID=A0A940WTJ7_9BACI|nr:thiol reductant ABC exporter subunit CydC [Bacillus suaedae]MBP3952489.1 thiol reductant ABC exporter subunit CydC [Bacillus suaedae]